MQSLHLKHGVLTSVPARKSQGPSLEADDSFWQTAAYSLLERNLQGSSLVVRTPGFHCWVPGSILGQGN